MRLRRPDRAWSPGRFGRKRGVRINFAPASRSDLELQGGGLDLLNLDWSFKPRSAKGGEGRSRAESAPPSSVKQAHRQQAEALALKLRRALVIKVAQAEARRRVALERSRQAVVARARGPSRPDAARAVVPTPSPDVECVVERGGLVLEGPEVLCFCVLEAAPFDLAARSASRELLACHYLLRQEGVIRTKTAPHLFYLPKKHTGNTERLHAESRDKIREQIGSLTAQLKRSLAAAAPPFCPSSAGGPPPTPGPETLLDPPPGNWHAVDSQGDPYSRESHVAARLKNEAVVNRQRYKAREARMLRAKHVPKDG